MKKVKFKVVSYPEDYVKWFGKLKKQIAGARQKAILNANATQIRLYCRIGLEILERQEIYGWGSKVIERLSMDLREAFPDMKGLSTRNLKYMKVFAKECPGCKIGQQSAAQLPWFHIVILLTKLRNPSEREWYAREAIRQSWSRDTLTMQIRNKLHKCQGAATTNFENRLDKPQADFAQEMLKDPYHFDFLGLGNEALERDIESALVSHITHFLLELGQGFAFVGRQFRLEVNGDEFFIDLLFYHTRLKCYVVVELKSTAFKPEHAGQLNFYLAAVDAQIKASDDRPSIGLLLCKTKNKLVAEYALSGIDKPIGVAEYQLLRSLPKHLNTSLPSIEKLELELASHLDGENLNG
ncbi:MAG: PDDEXK nuclease domain-containing protein [Fibrobacteraceae bacterium]|nr:PDDEXK nuclease domain-containing protein [Fibrobacteraceae bacterium]